MEVNLPVLFAVKVRKRKSVRLAIVPKEREHPALFIFEDFFAFLVTYLLFESSHRSEHGFSIEEKRFIVIQGVRRSRFALTSRVLSASLPKLATSALPGSTTFGAPHALRALPVPNAFYESNSL